MSDDDSEPFHTTLPAEAQRLLREAASTPITAKDPHGRERAINQAVMRIKRKYPDFYK